MQVEQDDPNVLRLRCGPLSKVQSFEKGFPYFMTLLMFVPLAALTLICGEFLIGSFFLALCFLPALGFWFEYVPNRYDEKQLTIQDNAVVFETISPNSKRNRKQELGQPQDLYFQAISSRKHDAALRFWLGKEIITMPCESMEQRDEIFAQINGFMQRFLEDRPQGVPAPSETRSFFRPTQDGGILDFPSPYSRSDAGERLAGFFLIVVGLGYWWLRAIWAIPQVVWSCIQFWQLFPPEEAVKLIAVLGVTWLIFIYCIVLLPLVMLYHLYWTGWSVRFNRQSDEVICERSSLFGKRQIRAPMNRTKVSRSKKRCLLRIFWLAAWFPFGSLWERDGVTFDFDGRKVVLPCHSQEEAEWLLKLLEKEAFVDAVLPKQSKFRT